MEEQCVWLQEAHRISRQAGRRLLILLLQGCEVEVPTEVSGCRYRSANCIYDHCLSVLFLSSFSSITMKKGNQIRSGAATRQRATSASMVCRGWERAKCMGWSTPASEGPVPVSLLQFLNKKWRKLIILKAELLFQAFFFSFASILQTYLFETIMLVLMCCSEMLIKEKKKKKQHKKLHQKPKLWPKVTNLISFIC